MTTRYSLHDWMRLAPLVQGAKRLRNDTLLARYRAMQPSALAAFLDGTRALRGKDIAITIAFEQPWALDWQLGAAAQQPGDRSILVFDNSRTDEARARIRAVCEAHGTPYLPLPLYRTRHVNRSHGMAMSWIFHNVVLAMQPRSFGFLDHDLIPIASPAIADALRSQHVYGMANEGMDGFWNLWAGYCFYAFAAVADKPLNFLYDFTRGLDTGGRNWEPLYRHLPRGGLRFASREFVRTRLPSGAEREVEVIDDAWLHIGGVGYNDNFESKFAFFEELRAQLALGRGLAEFRA